MSKKMFVGRELRKVCNEDFGWFTHRNGAVVFATKAGRYIHFDRGSRVLGVAHLDSHALSNHFARFQKAGYDLVVSESLDDRLGAYIMLKVLPRLGIVTDLLLTEGEESMGSTASEFRPPRPYNWAFEFDREGDDCALYQYGDAETADLVRRYGWAPALGSYTDIVDLFHLGVKCFNFGTGYYNFHGRDCYAIISETWKSVARFEKFYADFKDKTLLHDGRIRRDREASWAWDRIGILPRRHYYDVLTKEAPNLIDLDDGCYMCGEVMGPLMVDGCCSKCHCRMCEDPYPWYELHEGICFNCENDIDDAESVLAACRVCGTPTPPERMLDGICEQCLEFEEVANAYYDEETVPSEW